jgi:membrane-associated phospholipid phosphatase
MAQGLQSRARTALTGAGISVVLLLATWYASHYVALVKRVDASILKGFADFRHPAVDRLTEFVAHLCNPHPYVVLAAVPVLVALARRRPLVAVTVGAIMLFANETTQLLKPLLAAPRDPVSWIAINSASWPSGHATAAMSLALCAVIASPARLRPVVAAAMSTFAIAVCYSFLELGWHYPSDVLGGFLVATAWTLLGVAGLSAYEARRLRRTVSPTGAAAVDRPAFSIGQALTPAVALLAIAAVLIGLIVLARPHEVLTYARQHRAFVIGAGGIAVVGMTLASGLMLALRRGQ